MWAYLGGGDEGGRDGQLVFRAGRDVEADLPHDGHVQMVHQGYLEALAALVEELVVEALNVQQHGVAVVFSRLGALERERERKH